MHSKFENKKNKFLNSETEHPWLRFYVPSWLVFLDNSVAFSCGWSKRNDLI